MDTGIERWRETLIGKETEGDDDESETHQKERGDPGSPWGGAGGVGMES